MVWKHLRIGVRASFIVARTWDQPKDPVCIAVVAGFLGFAGVATGRCFNHNPKRERVNAVEKCGESYPSLTFRVVKTF
jgi:hypothetical protein